MGCGASSSPDAVAERNLTSALEVLFDAYGKPTEQIGYTDGHYCVTTEDKTTAMLASSSLLYGEILPAGITKILSYDYLCAARAQVLFDLGMGVGKLLLQAFLQYPNLRYCCGIELAVSRYNIAEQALLRMASLQPEFLQVDTSASIEGRLCRVHTISRKNRRTIEIRRGDMWKQARDLNNADIVLIHTDVPANCISQLKRTICTLKHGARFVTYQDLYKIWRIDAEPPFEQLAVNGPESDTFLTSWSSERGYHLYCWEKTFFSPYLASAASVEECKEAAVDAVPSLTNTSGTFMAENTRAAIVRSMSKASSHRESLVTVGDSSAPE